MGTSSKGMWTKEFQIPMRGNEFRGINVAQAVSGGYKSP